MVFSFEDSQSGNTLAHAGAERNMVPLLRHLVERVPHGNRMMLRPNKFGSTPLHIAAVHRHMQAVDFIVETAIE